MKTSLFVWLVIIGIFITVLFAFNYKGKDDTVPLSQIFPDEEVYPVDVEYEFVEAGSEKKTIGNNALEVKESTPEPVKEKPVVETKQEEPVKVAVAKTSKPKAVAYYIIQVASSKDKQKAIAAKDSLVGKGFDARVRSRDLGDKGVWYRIYVGNFVTIDEANIVLKDVKKLYPDSFVLSAK